MNGLILSIEEADAKIIPYASVAIKHGEQKSCCFSY